MMITGTKQFKSWTYSEYTLEDGGTLVVQILDTGESIYVGDNYYNGNPLFQQYDEDSLVAQWFDEHNNLVDTFAVDLPSVEEFDDSVYDTALKTLAKRIRECSNIENASYIVKH